MKTPDILNSKISKIRIELPHYSFSHSSAGDSPHAFIGRERVKEKIKQVIEDSPDEPGVYLIAGNRGVGKTSLISHVIKETSLQNKSKLTENLGYVILLSLAVAGILFLQCYFPFINKIWFIWPIIFVLSFITLCFYNGYRRKKNFEHFFISVFKELSCLINPYIQHRKTQYLLKISIVVSFTQIVLKIIFDTFGKINIGIISAIITFFCYLLIVCFIMYIQFFKKRWHKDKKRGFKKFFQILFRDSILNPIKHYIKTHNRLYLRINFGHKLKDEKDILRLITRTLSTEYVKYRRSIRRMFVWRAIAFASLLIFAHVFSGIVNKKNMLDNKNQQVISESHDKEQESAEGTSIKADDMLVTSVETLEDINDTLILKITKQKPILSTYAVGFLFTLGCFVKKYIPKMIFLLSFFLMYLFCILLFRCNWLTHFFVTHRIINRRLKKLNNDITYSTEREYSMGINNEKSGSIIGTKAKKSRNVADAREIEKELQDILSDMRRIPLIMCRHNIVIVFDELDKVEPGDASLDKENPQTKATLFSIGATRERQTEILRILSNMKYFLSTAKAKFIFIAGREMFDIHLADVSERNNYIGSIFNAVILVPSFLTDHHTGRKYIPQESTIASLPEEFVCRRLIPYEYAVKSYDLESYREYLEKEIFPENTKDRFRDEKIQKIIAVLQQFVIYLAHVSKGAPKKMVQLFDSFVEIHIENSENKKNTLSVQRYHGSRHFLSFNYYKQYTLGIVAYLITPIFHRLAESNIKEHSDKLLVSSLRFVDFLFKFHKHSFSWKHLDMSPEMLEVNRAPELKSVAVDLLNYLTQVHINRSNFSLSEYKFDGLIANEIFAMAKTDEVFSALFSFSLDETLPLKKHYQDLLKKTRKEYKKGKSPSDFIDAISSLQGVLGDLHYYDDELEEAEAYYKNAVQAFRKKGQSDNEKAEKEAKLTIEQLYVYVRNMLRLGIIYEKRKQYDFAYLTYGELCERIIRERNIAFKESGAGIELRREGGKSIFIEASTSFACSDDKYHDNIKMPKKKYFETKINNKTSSPQPLYFKEISPITNDMLFKKMTFEGLKMLYLPFIAKLQILELSHIGGITHNHLKQLDREFKFLTYIIDHKEAKLLEAEFYSRVADVLYYKNSDLKELKYKNEKVRKEDIINSSCTACDYYCKALYILLRGKKFSKLRKNTLIKLLRESVKQIKDNFNVKYCTILARILSDWGNVFLSCDNKKEKCECYICNVIDCDYEKHNLSNDDKICDINICETNYSIKLKEVLRKYINYAKSESKIGNRNTLFKHFNNVIKSKTNITKMEIAFAMYAISSVTYRKANLYKRSAYQIYKMLRLFKDYLIYHSNYIKQLSRIAIHHLWYANDDLNVLELNKRKKDFNKTSISDKDKIPLQNLLVDTEITRIRILVKELELKYILSKKLMNYKNLSKYYAMHITSPYRINYSIIARIYRLWLKSKVNYEAYRILIPELINLTKLISEYNNCSNDDYKNVIKKKLDDMDAVYDSDNNKYDQINSEIKFVFEKINSNKPAKEIFEDFIDFTNEKKAKIEVFENLIAETIYCLVDIAQLVETMDETYIFTHFFIGSIHEKLSFWIMRYEEYEIYKEQHQEIKNYSHIKEYLKQYLDEEWREQLSGYRENQRALSHYYKCLEMHNEGRAYHNMLDTMCYVKDDFNDRSDHFNIAEERHLILNKKIERKINELKEMYQDSRLHDVNNYFNESKDAF